MSGIQTFNESGIAKYFMGVCKSEDVYKNIQNFLPEDLNINSLPYKKPDYTTNLNFFNKSQYDGKRDFHEILHIFENDESKQWKLWYDRLVYVCYVLDWTYNELKNKMTPEMQKGLEEGYVQLGIFGSNKVTSDIDIGVFTKDSGGNSEITNFKKGFKLSEFCKTFEGKFQLDGKYTSLDLDVECYGDYFKDDITGKPYVITDEQTYDAVMPNVIAGILRNIIQVYYDNNVIPVDSRRVIQYIQSSNSQKCTTENTVEKEINKAIDIMKFGLFGIKEFVLNREKGLQSTFDVVCSKLIEFINNNSDKMGIAKDKLNKYLSSDYNCASNLYADSLDKVHKLKYIDQSVSNSKLAEALSEALIYRCESYISAATITDVVYMQQAKDESPELRRIIGKHGYLISCYEQMGYLLRFFYKCGIQKLINFYETKKYKKYMARYIIALNQYKNLSSVNSVRTENVSTNKPKKSLVNKTRKFVGNRVSRITKFGSKLFGRKVGGNYTKTRKRINKK